MPCARAQHRDSVLSRTGPRPLPHPGWCRPRSLRHPGPRSLRHPGPCSLPCSLRHPGPRYLPRSLCHPGPRSLPTLGLARTLSRTGTRPLPHPGASLAAGAAGCVSLALLLACGPCGGSHCAGLSLRALVGAAPHCAGCVSLRFTVSPSHPLPALVASRCASWCAGGAAGIPARAGEASLRVLVIVWGGRHQGACW